MNRNKPFLPLIILSPNQVFDAGRRVPYVNAPSVYARDEYSWWIRNTGQPTTLYMNGVATEQEFGTKDIDLYGAWQRQANANGVTVAVVDDYNGSHGSRIAALVSDTAPGVTVNKAHAGRYYPNIIAPAITAAVDAGNRIVVLATGYATPEPLIQAACEHARDHNCIIVCAAPNAIQDMDAMPDYPTSFGFGNILSVTSIDRTGNLYGWAGYGSRTIGAPGRNIMASGMYSSGTSYAAPIAAGCLALVIAQKPERTAAQVVSLALARAIPVIGTKRINPVGMLSPGRLDYTEPNQGENTRE